VTMDIKKVQVSTILEKVRSLANGADKTRQPIPSSRIVTAEPIECHTNSRRRVRLLILYDNEVRLQRKRDVHVGGLGVCEHVGYGIGLCFKRLRNTQHVRIIRFHHIEHDQPNVESFIWYRRGARRGCERHSQLCKVLRRDGVWTRFQRIRRFQQLSHGRYTGIRSNIIQRSRHPDHHANAGQPGKATVQHTRHPPPTQFRRRQRRPTYLRRRR